MPKLCSSCVEKRDFMEVDPPRTEKDFYKNYDPWMGVSTAILLALFFFVITVKSCVRYLIRKWRMHQFYKRASSGEENIVDNENCATDVAA
ncbi:hypothetical protein DICVIV_00926 [Dictyocaulus viviparus]|uniref:Uncharacterized protein n=1 Tax=Dictyocaulus viviparus TaxID=29172 RepID=A0A0D8Y832_DICVI|nr:hypothetical protein DICVIV_00926 [Dictyocaulus viviparus]